MTKKMLIDATHAEETRVVVVDGNKVEEFDFETASKRQLAGNIYLAKVTRVEPSLQAAFVDYGGNRHGFLAFAEIHPDYYQIPVADRLALLEEERAYAEAEAAAENGRERGERSERGGRGDRESGRDGDREGGRDGGRRSRSRSRSRSRNRDEGAAEDVAENLTADDVNAEAQTEAPTEGQTEATTDAATDAAPQTGLIAAAAEVVAEAEAESTPEAADDEPRAPRPPMAARTEGSDAVTHSDDIPGMGLRDLSEGEDDAPYVAADHATDTDDSIESVADEDVAEEISAPRRPRPRRYKIQEVIKVRQIMLVQVVKEERGNKGAALTTYLSLAGRYCVLMPNTARGGGISRKITNAADRKKLKEIAGELEVPQGAGLIIRTAGSQRTRTEIRRDYEYLMRLWEQVRDLTMRSIAPAPIYEEGDLIKRSIRDLYSKDIDEVLVEGERGYRAAKDFMKMIMPSHAKNVKHYAEALPLFARFQVESYLGAMFNPVVQLKSGGYIVIGVTEALVAIDVNSGRATKEGSIEDTAFKTNCEAADEIARQLRLRDLAGLIVIDFIDMEERKNNAAVEKRLKERLKTDRARIQVGRISGFGLLEMSRQRLRPGMLESTTQPCPHCHGTGLIRSDNSMALQILRQIEEEATRRRSREVLVRVPVAVANYLMNAKREHIALIEARYGMSVRIEADPALISPDFTMERFKTATRNVPEVSAPVVSVDSRLMAAIDEEGVAEVDEDDEDLVSAADEGDDEADTGAENGGENGGENGDGGKKRKRRRRKRRRGNGEGAENGGDEAAAQDDSAMAVQGDAPEAPEVVAVPEAEVEDEAPVKPARRRRRTKAEIAAAAAPAEGEVQAAVTDPAVIDPAAPEAEPAPKKRTRRKPKAEAETVAAPVTETADQARSDQAVEAEAQVAELVAEEAVAAPDEVVPDEPVAPLAEVTPAPEPQPEPQVEPVAEPKPEPEPEDPNKPKRRGWWSVGR
ncbi:Rne/Rng family ribonuclease [Paracoccus sp. p3-h83]|uniref:Rne/Rng family ribonuclease n=1 Tax=Paracoccus sp. p3-h83 TaxID=3342805 RepID=UPI0035B6D778